MNHERYNAITVPYQGRQKKRLLLSAVLMVLGFVLAATGIGAIMGIVSMIYLMMEGIRTSGLKKMKKDSLKKLERMGVLSDALASLDTATLLQVDGLTYAVSDKYLCLPHGALLPLADIAWIYQSEQTVRYFLIPVMKIRWCKVALLDGTDTLAFYGKVKDNQAFSNLLVALKARIPHLLLGYSAENQRLYQVLVAAHKKG